MALSDYMSLTEFRSIYTEFKTLNDSTVSFWLEQAQQKINPTVWVNSTKIGHGTWTAHLIAISPYGMNLRLQNADGTTDYFTLYEQLLKGVGGSALVCNVS